MEYIPSSAFKYGVEHYYSIRVKHVEQCLEHSKYLISISCCYYNKDISPFYNLSAPHCHLLLAFHRQLVSSQGSGKAMKGLGVKYLIRCGQEHATGRNSYFTSSQFHLRGANYVVVCAGLCHR